MSIFCKKLSASRELQKIELDKLELITDISLTLFDISTQNISKFNADTHQYLKRYWLLYLKLINLHEEQPKAFVRILADSLDKVQQTKPFEEKIWSIFLLDLREYQIENKKYLPLHAVFHNLNTAYLNDPSPATLLWSKLEELTRMDFMLKEISIPLPF